MLARKIHPAYRSVKLEGVSSLQNGGQDWTLNAENFMCILAPLGKHEEVPNQRDPFKNGDGL
jgi:hypothetical protein